LGRIHRSRIGKKKLEELFANDEIGLIPDEAGTGKFLWVRKFAGAVVTSKGELYISGRTSFPTMQDVPVKQAELNRYTKVFPLAYNFFKTYLGKGEYAWISDVLADSKVLVVAPGTLGERHFNADKATKTIRIEEDFLNEIMQAGMKRVGMGLFAEAATTIAGTDQEKAQQIVDKISRMSLTGKNRLENAIYLFNLKAEIEDPDNSRKLTAAERQFFLTDIMERNRSFNGRRAAKLLRETFGYFGEVTPEAAEKDLRAIKKATEKSHPGAIVIDPYRPRVKIEIKDGKEIEVVEETKYTDKTDTFRVNGRYMADTSLIEGRNIVWDYEVDATDAFLFGGKVAYTGMMQWTPGVNTLPMFATSGRCFKNLISYNKYTEEFHRIAADLTKGLAKLEKQFGKDSEGYNRDKGKLVRESAARFQNKLDWEVAEIPPELRTEIKDSLVIFANRLNTSVFRLILAIRSSAIGEDSEAASFAGRQDTSLYVGPLMEELAKRNLKPEDFKNNEGVPYTFKELEHNIFAWYDILDQVKKQTGDQIVTDQMLDIFVKEWLANQRSLFNGRSIEYRLEKEIPVFTDEVEMSSVFQEQANTEYGFVAFGVDKATGYSGVVQLEVIEGQTNPLVDGSGTGDLVFISQYGQDQFHSIKVPDDGRQAIHLPNMFGAQAEVAGEIRKGGVVSIKFPDELKGKPAISDMALLAQMGQSIINLNRFFGMFSDIEGGLIVRRDAKGNVLYIPDANELDGIAKDASGNKRKQVVLFYTQIRPETVQNFRNPDVIEQHWYELKEGELEKIQEQGKVLYATSQAQTQGVAQGEVFIVVKENPDDWYKVKGRIMVTHQSDPDMNDAMRQSEGIGSAVGGRNSHTMIVATEYGLIAVSGLGDIDKFYNGQKVTIDATNGKVYEGDDWVKVPAGNDYNIRELGILPQGFSLGLNLNTAELAQKASPLRNKPDFYGSGLVRLELFLEYMGGAGEGFLRYDSYKLHAMLEKMDSGKFTASERIMLNQIFKSKDSLKSLNPRVTKDNTIVTTVNGKEKVYISGLEFFRAHIEDPKYPRYSLDNPEEAKIIREFDKKVQRFLTGEARYVDIMYRGIKNICEPLIVDPLEIKVFAQRIENAAVRKEALALAREYARIHAEKQGALPTDEIIKQVTALREANSKSLSSYDNKVLLLMGRSLSIAFYIRTDDRKSDEYANVMGSMVEIDRVPMFGYRGIRLMLDNPKVTAMQLAAIKKVVDIGAKLDDNGNPVGKGKYRIRIFSPIVYDPDHVRQMNALFDAAGLTADRVDRGIMTETPQSAEIRPFLEAGIAFSSTGGNDMLQSLHEVDRQNAAKYYNSINSRSVQSLRVLATIANETKRWNRSVTIPQGRKPVTCGYCGNWPADEAVGALALYLSGYDSASITVPSMDRSTNDLYGLLDHMYGHDDLKILNVPEDKEQVVRDLYALIADPAKQEGLSDRIIKMLPDLKVVLDNRNFSIYDQIDSAAKPEIISDFTKVSVSDLNLALPFHYRLLEGYDGETRAAEFDKDPAALQDQLKSYIKLRAQNRIRLDQIKNEARLNHRVPPEDVVAKINADNKALTEMIKDRQYLLRGMEFFRIIDKILGNAGYDITQSGLGRKFYVERLKSLVRQQAVEATRQGKMFIVESAKEPADYLKYKAAGDAYELPKEPNPDIGNRGMKKALTPDRQIFKWTLEAVKELREEGLNVSFALSKVRELSELDDVQTLLKETGATTVPIGLVNDSPNIIYAIDEYLAVDRGIDFVMMDRKAMRDLAEAKRCTEWDNNNTVLITDADVDRDLKDVSIPVTKTAAAKHNVPLYLSSAEPEAKVADATLRALTGKASLDVIEAASKLVYGARSFNYKEFLPLLKNDAGAIIVSAQVIIDNAGSAEAIEEFKKANRGVKIIVWTGKQSDVKAQKTLEAKLNILGISEFVVDFEAALEQVREVPVFQSKAILLLSQHDQNSIKQEFKVDSIAEFLGQHPMLRARVVRDSDANNINDMPFILSYAAAAATKNAQAQTAVLAWADQLFADLDMDAETREKAVKKLTEDIGASLGTMPMSAVSTEVAQDAATYRETLRRLDIGV